MTSRITAAVFVLIGLIAGATDRRIRVTADELISDYLDNRTAADAKYIVTGTVISAERNQVDLNTNGVGIVRCTSGGPFDRLRRGQKVGEVQQGRQPRTSTSRL